MKGFAVYPWKLTSKHSNKASGPHNSEKKSCLHYQKKIKNKKIKEGETEQWKSEWPSRYLKHSKARKLSRSRVSINTSLIDFRRAGFHDK